MLSDHKNLSTLQPPSSSHIANSGGQSTSGFNYLLRYHAGHLGTKPDVLTHHKDVYPGGEHAYALANPHNFQSMFKVGQLLCAIILDSASLLVSI